MGFFFIRSFENAFEAVNLFRFIRKEHAFLVEDWHRDHFIYFSYAAKKKSKNNSLCTKKRLRLGQLLLLAVNLIQQFGTSGVDTTVFVCNLLLLSWSSHRSVR